MALSAIKVKAQDPDQMQTGVILQATYRILERKPVVYLFGRLVDGRTFLVRDFAQIPHFYVAQEHASDVRGAQVSASDMCSFNGTPLARVDVRMPADAPPVRDALHTKNIPTYEADVRFAYRYLIDRGIKSGVNIVGTAHAGQGTDLVFDNPHLHPSDASLVPKVLCFDIETNPNTADGQQRLLAIACYSDDVDEVVVVDPAARNMPANAIAVPNEKAALAHFCQLVRRLDIDVLTGWNVIDFDLTVLDQVAKRVGYDLQLGREPGHLRMQPARGYFGSGSASIPGRLVLDGLDLLRGAFVKMDDYTLETVAQEVLGEGKTLGHEGADKVAEILANYEHDLPSFCVYARTDARLALQIVERLELIKLAFARAALTGMTPDRVAASIASFDFLYLSALAPMRIAAPSVQQPGTSSRIAQGGGAVFEPVVGVHRNVWVCDFKSLYPSIIRTFNIDPLGFVRGQTDTNPITTFDGTRFERGHNILPGMLDRLFPQREEAKRAGDAIASQAIKILMNSFYGVLGTPACRFYNPALANAITSQGRYFLSWSRNWFEVRGYQVLYGDTDSVFVASGIQDAEAAQRAGTQLMTEFNAQLNEHITDSAGVESRLELEFEKLYTQLFLASVRGGSQGARKRYAGQKYGEQALEFVGMEVVRRDWTELAKEVQRNLFERMFSGAEVAGYLAEIVARLRQGELDDKLIYRKGLRKPVSAYTANVPPHVQAVKKSKLPAPRVVRYVMTTAGPELVDEQLARLDRDHYVEKQIKPVAQPVLEALGLEFSQVIGDDRQIALF